MLVLWSTFLVPALECLPGRSHMSARLYPHCVISMRAHAYSCSIVNSHRRTLGVCCSQLLGTPVTQYGGCTTFVKIICRSERLVDRGRLRDTDLREQTVGDQQTNKRNFLFSVLPPTLTYGSPAYGVGWIDGVIGDLKLGSDLFISFVVVELISKKLDHAQKANEYVAAWHSSDGHSN